MSSSSKGVVNVKRREWDEATYLKRQIQREDEQNKAKEAEQDAVVTTSFGTLVKADLGAAGPSRADGLAYLDTSARIVDFSASVGKTQVFEGARAAGFQCCDRVFADSKSLQLHINSREHQARMGFSMMAAPVAKEDVRAHLAAHTERAASGLLTKVSTTNKKRDTLESRMAEMNEAEEAKRQSKKTKRTKLVDEEIDPDLAAMLGASSSKKS